MSNTLNRKRRSSQTLKKDYRKSYIEDGNALREDGNALRYADNAKRRKSTVKYQKPSVRDKNIKVRKNQAQAALGMDFPFLLILTVALVCILYLFYSYLHVQDSVTTTIRNIEVKERELAALKNQNDALEINIKSSVDLDHIYEVATKELGMVYAKKDQIIKYNTSEKEYVRQYEDIPDR